MLGLKLEGPGVRDSAGDSVLDAGQAARTQGPRSWSRTLLRDPRMCRRRGRHSGGWAALDPLGRPEAAVIPAEGTG